MSGGAGVPQIRRLGAGDLDFAVAQSEREGWTTSRAWFEALLAHDGDGGFVAEVDGRRVGLATTTRYAQSGWIGNLIVLPAHRGGGLGSRLFERCLDRLRATGLATIRLEADPPGVNIYRRFGFADEFTSLRFRRAGPAPEGARGVVRLDAAALPAIARCDAIAFGDDRARFLGLLHGRAEAAFGVPAGDGVGGYALVGPLVADDPGIAERLLHACLAVADGRLVTIDIPGPNRAAVTLVRALGFEETAPSLRMILGVRHAGGDLERNVALATGATG
ncbi:MAG: GCN5-related N-acetyltransferase [Acidobacteria bacterium]|nr:GCN5-related N-acetyltransferase [Acidobacteriota bacterium]